MNPSQYKLVVWAGGTFRLTITVLQSDGVTPENYTGYTAQLLVLPQPDADPSYTMTTENGKITLGGELGTVNLYIPAADTLMFSDWPTKAAVYELDVIDTGGNGDTIPLLWGPIQVQGLR